MNIVGPERYELTYDEHSFAVHCKDNTPKFSGIAASKMPKLYIASINDVPVYVGITKRRMSERLRYGWNVTGQHGYHGYVWRRTGTNAVLHVWGDEDQALERDHLDLETVEAEIVYLIRVNGQWPQFQTEIHFHPSTPEHRKAAEGIFSMFRVPQGRPYEVVQL